MRYLRLALLPLVLAACAERDTAAPDTGMTPDFGATASNDVVYLHPGRTTWMDSDTDPDVLLLGYEPAEDGFCNDGEFPGGIPVREHYVVSSEGMPDPFSGRDQYVLTTVGRAPLYLYLIADFPPPGATVDQWCAFLTDGWIASGHWSATLGTDNDVSGGDGTPGVNTWGGTEAGVLLGRDGSKYRYSWKYRSIWEPERDFFIVANSVDEVQRIGN